MLFFPRCDFSVRRREEIKEMYGDAEASVAGGFSLMRRQFPEMLFNLAAARDSAALGADKFRRLRSAGRLPTL